MRFEIPSEGKSAQAHFSPYAERFLGYAERHPALFERRSFEPFFSSVGRVVDNISCVPSSERYALQPWPVLISPEKRREHARAAVELVRLIRDIPRRFFGGDPRALAEYFGLESEAMASLLLSEPNLWNTTLTRGDFIESRDGLKCIEFNFGNVGGWQDCVFASLYPSSPEIREFLAEEGVELHCLNSIHLLFRHILEDLRRRGQLDGGRADLLVIASDGGTTGVGCHPQEAYQRELEAVATEMGGGLTASVKTARLSDVQLRGGAWVDGVRYPCVIEHYDTEYNFDIYRAFKAGELSTYTNPIGMIVGDKRLLALLSENRYSSLLSEDERRLVAELVPWTRRLLPREATFHGETTSMLELAERHRENLVLKPGGGYGGASVHIGRAEEPVRWRELLAAAIDDQSWVIQERVEAIPQIFQTGEEGYAYFDVNWGLFVFGESYGGYTLRMSPHGGSPVVNVSRGARIGVVFEVTPT